MVATRLLEEDYDVFFPFVDDVSGIDLVSYKDGVFDSLQVRYHKVKQGKSSLTFNVNPCQADTIALPIGNKICFVPTIAKGKDGISTYRLVHLGIIKRNSSTRMLII